MVIEMLLLLAQLLVLRVVVRQVQDQLSHQENRDKIETVTLLKKKRLDSAPSTHRYKKIRL